MSQKEAGHLIGVHVSTIQLWEANNANPRHKHWAKIVEFLGFDASSEN